MTEITPEALEALSKKATQGVWDIAAYYTGTGPDENCRGLVEVEDFPIGIIDEEGATAESLSPNLEFIVTLVNAYRTGQLILAQPSGDEVEACRYPVHGSVTHVRNVECCDFCGHPADTIPTAAITALDAHRGKQACLKARENADG